LRILDFALKIEDCRKANEFWILVLHSAAERQPKSESREARDRAEPPSPQSMISRF
jgi:hypothetical protein